MSKVHAAVVVLMMAGPVLLMAQEVALKLDPARTTIQWTLSATLHTVRGTFQLKRGTLQFDPSSGKAQGEIVVDMLSAESGNGMRDKQMHKDVLETSKFAEAIFAPNRVQGRWAEAGPSKLTFQGTFKLHGADHPLNLEVRVQRAGKDYTADTRFVVPYIEWGMKNPSVFGLRVGEKVNVAIHATGTSAH